jgi:opacity protein-like surface antigen
LRAQERVRTSATATPIESFTRSPEAFFYLGPFEEELTGTVGVNYIDNVNLSPANKVSDLNFNEGLSMKNTWVISHFNQLQLVLGGHLTENLYGDGRTQTNFTIDPDSLAEFKFQVGDWQVRLYDQFSYIQNPTTDPTATNTANLNSLNNTIGTEVKDDLNIAILSLTADYTYNTQSGTTAEGQTNSTTSGTRESLRFGTGLTFRLSPTIVYGVNIDASRSSGVDSANVNSLNFGPFMKGKLTRDLEFDLAGGASLIDTKPAIPPGYYLSAAIRYTLNRHWQIIFSGSHDLIFTAGTSLTEQNLLKIGTQLDITRAISLSASPFINWGTVETTGSGQSIFNSFPPGPYTLFGFETTLAWKPRKRWTTSLTYNYTRRESSSAPGAVSDSYIVNTITLSIGYAF